MDLRALRYFTAVFETGSISAASKACFIAQPSISSSLQQLENSLGKQLFKRHARGVIATEAGQQLYPVAKQLLGQANAIKDMFKHSDAKEPFRLGLTKGLGVARMSLLLKQFTAANKNMELTLVPTEEECDARIINKADLTDKEQWVSLWQERFSLSIPVNHPLSLKKKITIDDLQDAAFIQRTPCEAWNILKSRLNEANVKLDIRAKIQTVEYAVGLVKAGVGCALIPDYSEIGVSEELVFRYIENVELSRHIGLAYKEASSFVNSFIDILATQSFNA
ncbi:LysR family transcriptional regulator [Alteromonas sp. a30]|uniref:LysR family transcriptional regulator n=1 Tax=Alteromonas sp. a30 TaxID=2730917 RepID=UPI00227E273C|nr:LysR family transcriptional regulator [Alteromonas sp. a30]MCY7297374.1 LysR family transcriptional regulator [Alteromonas sp. a30]